MEKLFPVAEYAEQLLVTNKNQEIICKWSLCTLRTDNTK